MTTKKAQKKSAKTTADAKHAHAKVSKRVTHTRASGQLAPTSTVQNQIQYTNKSNSSVTNVIKLILFLLVLFVACFYTYKLITGFFDGVGESLESLSRTLDGHGTASLTDPRGRTYNHTRANLSEYENDDIVAMVYLDVSEVSGNESLGLGNIKGTVLNNTGKDLSYMSIEYGLYYDGAKYASCYANVSSLNSNAKWDYDAVCLGWRNGSTKKLEDLTWY